MYTFEAFESIDSIARTKFYRYYLHAYSHEGFTKKQEMTIRTQLKPYLEKSNQKVLIIDAAYIWLLAPLVACPPITGFCLMDAGWYEADYEKDQNVYVQYIEQCLSCFFHNTLYTQIDAHTFQSKFIYEIKDVLRNRQGIIYERQYHFYIKMNAKGKVLLLVSYNGLLRSEKNVYEWLKQGTDVRGLFVQYDWSTVGGIGKIQNVLKTTISEMGGLTYMGEKISLLDYYVQKGQTYFIKDFTAEDEAACIVEASFKDKTYEFIPQALTPIMTRETLASLDPDFSKKLLPYMKQNATNRFKILQHFVSILQQDNKQLPVLFDTSHYCEDLSSYSMEEGCFKQPLLKGGKENHNPLRRACLEKQRIFKEGFYKEAKESFNLVIFYPKQKYEMAFSFARILEAFTTRGIWQEKRNASISHCLFKQLQPLSNWQFCAYDSHLLEKMKKEIIKRIEKTQLILVMTEDEDLESYDYFKLLGATLRTPSQMLTLTTVQHILNQDSIGFLSLKNLILGMLVKRGGIPWLAEAMPGNTTCFIGLDVAMQSMGVHYAACSVVFSEEGEVLGYYKPKTLQTGEKITAEVLAELFDKVLHKYKVQYGDYPKHIVIHRDGFSNEQLEWYEAYFKRLNISFDLVEIRKNCRRKIVEIGQLGYHNPAKGAYLLEGQKGYLVTTQIEEKKGMGTPSVLMVEKIYGETDLKILLEQIFILAEIHVGALQNTRLPITTGYADSMCKAINYLPEGRVDNKLYFI